MNISPEGLEFIKQQEGLRLTAYQDVAGIWTIGYGSTSSVNEGLQITESEASDRLSNDIQTAEKCVNNAVNCSITQNQFDALCSFVFNIGCRNLRNSTLLQKLNDGDDVGAADEFSRWDHSGGIEVAGLTRRREAEKELFLS